MSKKSKMQFNCKQIKYKDDALGCSIMFCENGQCDSETSYSNSITKNYFFIKRSYSDTENEPDFLYIETIEPDKSGPLEQFQINLYRNIFLIKYQNFTAEITIEATDSQFTLLQFTLKKIVGSRGLLHFSNT